MRAILMLCAMSLLWGSAWLVAPSLAAAAAPHAAAALTLLLATLALVPFRTVRVAHRVPPATSLALGVCMLAVPACLLVYAAGHGAASWVPLVYSLLPLVLALPRDAWSPAMVLAVPATFVLLNGSVAFTASSLVPALAAFAAVLSQAWAMGWAARQLAGCPRVAILRSLAVQCAGAGALLGFASLLFDHAPRLAAAAQWTAGPALSLLLLAVPGTALAHALLYRLLGAGVLQPQQVAASQWLQLLCALGEGAVLERYLPPWQWLLAAAVLGGCAVAVLRAGASGPESPVTFGDTAAF